MLDKEAISSAVDAIVREYWAQGALLTTTPGDTTMVTLKQVRAFASGGSGAHSALTRSIWAHKVGAS